MQLTQPHSLRCGLQDSPMGFVATNPLPETILCSGDRMYVITCEFEYV